jgi:hypothetical protein
MPAVDVNERARRERTRPPATPDQPPKAVDFELAIDMLAGPIIYRFLITGGDLAPAAAAAPRLLETLLEGLRRRPRGR